MENILDCTAGRWDLYGPVHKGLRFAHARMLAQIGRADFTADTTKLIGDLRIHLIIASTHLFDEERYIHAALEAKLPGASAELEDDHDHHRLIISAIETALYRIEAGEKTALAGRELYRLFNQFVADDLNHMAQEESVYFPLLCQHFTDAELMEIEHDIVGGMAPELAGAFAQIMLPAANIDERISLLRGMRQGMPSPAYGELYRAVVAPVSSNAELERLKALV